MIKNKIIKIEAAVITIFLIGTMGLVPVSSIGNFEEIESYEITGEIYRDPNVEPDLDFNDLGPFWLDRKYIIPDPNPANLLDDDFDDAGTRRDAGDKISRSTALYPGEPIDDTPGRGRTGKLTASDEDYYRFSACEGQSMTISVDATCNADLFLWDDEENLLASSESTGHSESLTYTASYTGLYYMEIECVSDSGEYEFDVVFNNQNDLGNGNDAGDSFNDATPLSQGEFYGFLDMNDNSDWYRFNVANGQGIHVILEMKTYAYLADFDISLYNPNGELVFEEDYYYDDELLYPADMSGEWRIKIDIFPGYEDIPQPTEWKYYTYGSGAYKLTFALETSAPAPPAPIPQPQITPMAKSFMINNDPNSNNDEYAYLASIPSCNYYDNGMRYLSPIFYQGDNTPTNYFKTDKDRGVVDDTTQYLIDDWDAYLSGHTKSSNQYMVPSDPIVAAADIATQGWTSSDMAVIAIDGSNFEDNVETLVDSSETMIRDVEIETLDSSDPVFLTETQHLMFLGKEYGAISVEIHDITGYHSNNDANFLWCYFPTFMNFAGDWWPVPYDGNGDGVDIYYPITQPGLWATGSDITPEDWSQYIIKKYAGDRYTLNVNDEDSVLNVTINTDTESDLLVFLVDPNGFLREPDIPQWNGPVLPIHEWHALENPPDNPWRTWDPEPHTSYSVEVLHPEQGRWTAIVVPRHSEGTSSIPYSINAELRTTNTDRADAAISAANAAVIASQMHVPLLYVTPDTVPSETESAISQLGVNKVVFVERGSIGTAVKNLLPTLEADLTTMSEIVNYIKGFSNTENYITITSIKSGDGYFAPAAMMAAYHCSPVLRIGDMPGNPAAMADRIETWRLWAGDFYHGSRSTGHLPEHDEPIEGEGEWTFKLLLDMLKFALSGGTNGELPPAGLDAKRYWNSELHDEIYDYISGLGLDKQGQEAYCFVAPRKDIYIPAMGVMMGNNSYSGQMVGITPAYTSAMVCRNILYPAVIFANPNRDVTTSQMMNFADGGQWRTNDGITTAAYSSRSVKKSFGSHLRTFEGHCLWDAHLQRMNEGASAMYYAGHGTGGSGTSAQYVQTEHCNYPEQIWWDAWRGYSGFDNWNLVRNNGRSWYNAEPPSLYDIVHYDYADELFENLMSNAIFYLSCTTADAFGPMVYLDHGSVLWFGNAGSGLTPQEDLMDNQVFERAMVYGEPVAKAFADKVWLHLRDYTTKDPTAMYGPSSLGLTTLQCHYGDPELIIYSPDWTSPIPVDA